MAERRTGGRATGETRGTDEPTTAERDGIGERVAELGEFIKVQRQIASMSVRRLAELAGMSNPYLSQIERGLRRPSAEILQQLAKALQISAETLYVRAGFLSDDAEPMSQVRDAIAADRRLTAEQKQALRNVYDSFVGTDR
ncbi:MAG: helix-turn-helix domain-containing protein [Acidimicrobiia bacterium]|jgi:transcriptional regulator with XRE-family HTH domain|nr:helix-turn-helix domain-containing protein [Acidimicrobiia bacterium]MBA3982909.1 helix-turn-helix domain-containing protein [Acidimicrobiia bacterium]